jgi:hypothetical protein
MAGVICTAQCGNVRENVIGTAPIFEETYWKDDDSLEGKMAADPLKNRC